MFSEFFSTKYKPLYTNMMMPHIKYAKVAKFTKETCVHVCIDIACEKSFLIQYLKKNNYHLFFIDCNFIFEIKRKKIK